MVEEDYYRKVDDFLVDQSFCQSFFHEITLYVYFSAQVTGFQRLSNMCEVDIDIFCDGDRQHMKEGIVLVVRRIFAAFTF